MSANRAGTTRRELPVLPAAVTGDPATGGPALMAGAAPAGTQRGAAAGLRVALVTLGCDKNTVDSERLLAELLAAGARVSADAAGADVLVVNTCGFIDIAREESVDAILDAIRLKEAGDVRAVVAVGCLIQRHKAELRAELPEVDVLLGTTETAELVPELRRRGLLPPAREIPVMERSLRVLSGSSHHTSYLKISEGCDHGCAFCAIPLMRGRHRSTPIERLVQEARELEAAGVVELNIVSQDTTWYGRDTVRGLGPPADGRFFAGRVFAGMAGVPAAGPSGPDTASVPVAGRRRTADAGRVRPAAGARAAGAEPAGGPGLLPDLLEALLQGTGIPWLRLFYLYPSGIRPELVELIAREPRIVRYVDMPIQHGADGVLARMRRPERQATIRERVAWLRAAIPEVTLRTTVIVGFPGERDEDFETMLELLEELRFDHLGAFAYSREEGTPAARMPAQVPEALRRERLERVLELQRAIALDRNEERLGRVAEMLVERVAGQGAGGRITARAPWQAPELDGVVRLLPSGGARVDLRPGNLVRARVVEVSEDDLVARILD